MHYLYILYSKKLDKYYVGETPNVKMRLEQHNKHHFKKNYTKSAQDWILLLEYECNNKSDILFLEKFIKRMKSRVFIEKIIKSPKILSEILEKK